MRTHLNRKAAALCLLFLPLAACMDNAAEPAATCYQGEIVENGACDVAVRLINADFGVSWQGIQGSLQGPSANPPRLHRIGNVVYIKNLPDSLKIVGGKIYFTGYADDETPACLAIYANLPDKTINAFNISNQICKDNEK